MDQENRDDKTGFDLDDVRDLVEYEESSVVLYVIEAASIALSLVAICLCSLMAYKFFADDEISVISMPNKIVNDGVSLGRPREMWTKQERSNHIKAFLVEYIRAMHPQDASEIGGKMLRMKNLSVGVALDDAYSRYKLQGVYERDFMRYKISFYPDSMLTGVTIKENYFGWEARVQGSLIKLRDGVEYRSRPVMVFEIKEVSPSVDNPWGMAVSNFKYENKGKQ